MVSPPPPPPENSVTFTFNGGIHRRYSKSCMEDIHNPVLIAKFEKAISEGVDVELTLPFEEFKLVCRFIASPPRRESFFAGVVNYVNRHQLRRQPAIETVCNYLEVFGTHYQEIINVIEQVQDSIGREERDVHIQFADTTVNKYLMSRLHYFPMFDQIKHNACGFSSTYPLYLPVEDYAFENVLIYLECNNPVVFGYMFASGGTYSDPNYDVLKFKEAAVYLKVPLVTAAAEAAEEEYYAAHEAAAEAEEAAADAEEAAANAEEVADNMEVDDAESANI